MLTKFESFDLIPINSILSQSEENRLHFYVPAYQRGYRWCSTQVDQLIDDLLEFNRLHIKRSDFYCLQPLVVKSITIDDKEYLEVIDGQQRLTTILLILQAIQQKRHETYNEKSPARKLINPRFDITYETRPSSEDWLKQMGTLLYDEKLHKEFDAKSCDYSHFAEVFTAAYSKLKSMDEQELIKFYDCLTQRTYFIWYYPQESDGTNADIFDRLNAGKITLNNAELIKAIMLQRSNIAADENSHYDSLLRSVAIEWDNIERHLNDEEFWGFIYSSNHPFEYDTHIEYLFDLFQRKQEKDRDKLTFTFSRYLDSYREMMANGGDKDVVIRKKWVEREWLKVKELFDTLNEWYADRNLYHRIGFILEYCSNENLLSLYTKLKPLSRLKKISTLDDIIATKVKGVTSNKLFYGKPELSMILFLYNVLLEDRRSNKTARFSFADYKNVRKNTGWDQEHVASHIDYTVNEKDRISLGRDLIQFITGSEVIETPTETNSVKTITFSVDFTTLADIPKEEQELCKAWINVLNNDGTIQSDEGLNAVYDRTLNYYQGNEPQFGRFNSVGKNGADAKDFIWNFVLLNSKTNRSYGNNIYPIKRKRILADEFKVYTPVGTRNVFEKTYSRRITQMTSWSPTDAAAYWTDIKAVVSKYVTLTDLK